MPRILMERSGEMEVFTRVVQEGGFSSAARTLDLTPSAVSKLIARLEERLGVRLFVRTTRALALTDEGEAYHRSAIRILQELNSADQAVTSGNLRGRLSISSSIPFGTMFVAPAIAAFRERNPNLLIDLSFTDDVINLLAQKADVAIRMGDLTDSALVAKKLGQSRRVVCAAPSYLERHGTPKTPADLAQHDCLRFNFRRSRIGWPFKQNGRDFEQPINGGLLINNGESMKQLVLEGNGIARLGLFHVAGDIEKGELVPLLERFNPGDLEIISAVYVGGGHVPRRIRSFVDYMAEYLGSVSAFARR